MMLLRELRHDASAIIQLTRYLADAVQFGAVKDLDTLAKARESAKAAKSHEPHDLGQRGPKWGLPTHLLTRP